MPIETAASWPGSAPTLDAVMHELRRIDERLRCVGAMFKIDAGLMRELADHRQDPVRNPHPVIEPKQRSAFVRRAEALLVFGGYCEKERQRLAEKAHHLAQGTLDVERDNEWRISNERIAESAIAMENAA